MPDTLSSFIGQVKIGDNIYPVGSLLYGTCSIAAETAAKVVNSGNLTTASFTTLPTGITIHIKFDNSNTAENPTLKVGNTDAKPIKKAGTTAIGQTAATSWVAGAIVSFTYDGTNWVINTGIDTNTTYTPSDAEPQAIVNSTVGATAGLSDNYSRADHTHEISVAAGSNDGEIVIAGQTVIPHGLSTGAYATVATGAIQDNDTSTHLPTKAQVSAYIANKLGGLTGAMHFIGNATSAITDGGQEDPVITGYNIDFSNNVEPTPGDVVIWQQQEFVWTGTAWELLGAEGSYALNSNTASIGSASFVENSNITIPNVDSVGQAASFSVSNGTLTLTAGVAPSMGTAISIPTIRIDSTTVVIPTASSSTP